LPRLTLLALLASVLLSRILLAPILLVLPAACELALELTRQSFELLPFLWRSLFEQPLRPLTQLLCIACLLLPAA
jgi:hypothetical protein